jgi:hypothetical protein
LIQPISGSGCLYVHVKTFLCGNNVYCNQALMVKFGAARFSIGFNNDQLVLNYTNSGDTFGISQFVSPKQITLSFPDGANLKLNLLCSPNHIDIYFDVPNTYLASYGGVCVDPVPAPIPNLSSGVQLFNTLTDTAFPCLGVECYVVTLDASCSAICSSTGDPHVKTFVSTQVVRSSDTT